MHFDQPRAQRAAVSFLLFIIYNCLNNLIMV
nr:MAG TPA: hypothetical protein [Microviridae sp.]